MGRLPFDPGKTAAARRAAEEAASAPAPRDGSLLGAPAPRAGSPSDNDPRLTVSQLADRIENALKSGFPSRVRVVGEISNFTDRTHWYFDLKDASAVVNCVMFAAPARKVSSLGIRPQQGMQVVVAGRVEYYAKGGRISLLVDSLEPVGIGALDLAFRQLCDELKALGYFAIERKRPLPFFPRRIAVVTSRTGAALQDVLNTVRRRCPAVSVVLADVRVQGDGAASEVASAIQTIGRTHADLAIDAVLVTRGGGSKEDLWTFNERIVADAILRCPIPVVAAIGHETDTTIAELVADERCATPTQAAMRLTPEIPALLRQTESVHRRLSTTLEIRLRRARDRVDAASKHLPSGVRLLTEKLGRRTANLSARLDRAQPSAIRARMAGKLGSLSARLDAALRRRLASLDLTPVESRLARAMNRYLETRADRIDALDRQLELVGPQKVLERGYTLTTDAKGRLVRSVTAVTTGDQLTTRFADGKVDSTVGGQTPPRLILPRKPGRTRRPGDQPPVDPDQLDLFLA
jgi:exodeoxyribonuclease VII large subunit